MVGILIHTSDWGAQIFQVSRNHLKILDTIWVTCAKKIFTQELEGTRRRGRHRKGWKEEVERDLRVLGMRRWRELVIDREKWKDIV